MRTFLLQLCLIVSMAATAKAQALTDVRCLAENIAREAPDEPYNGKLAVATVTMNRVKSKMFPKTICDVVFQKNRNGCQFSWTCSKRKTIIDSSVYKQAVAIAQDVLNGTRLQSIKNALYFHNTKVSPKWSKDRDIVKVVQIGHHIFYASNPGI